MRSDVKRARTRRFSAIDVVVDVAILAWPAFGLLGFRAAIPLARDGRWLAELLHVLLLALGYFGVALYVSRMYAATALKTDQQRHVQVLLAPAGLQFFAVLVFLALISSGYAFYLTLTFPIFTAMLVVPQALWLGFSLGLDFEIPRHRLEDPQYIPPKRIVYSQSLSSIPYLVTSIAFVFPTEFFMSPAPEPLGLKVLIAVASVAAAIATGAWLDRRFFQGLSIGANPSPLIVALVSLLMILGFAGVVFLTVAGDKSFGLFGRGIGAKIISLLVFGVVPLRVGTVIFSRANLANKLMALSAVIVFLLIETGAIPLPHVL